MGEDAIKKQACDILEIWQNAGRTVLAGPVPHPEGEASVEWFARVQGGPTFKGEDLTDALAQLTTWFAAGAL